MDGLSDPVVIGVVVAPHGVHGTLRVRAVSSGKHLRKGMKPVVAGTRRRISAVKETPKGFLIDLEGVEGRADVDALRGEEFLLGRGELDAPEEGEFYVADLVGLRAVGDHGETIGTVRDTFDTGAHEVLIVRDEKGQDVYVPFTLEHVPELDLGSRQVVVRPPES